MKITPSGDVNLLNIEKLKKLSDGNSGWQFLKIGF